MPELFVQAQTGDDADPGTAAEPKQTIAAVNTFLAANPTDSTVHLAGKFQLGEAILATGLTDINIQQWAGGVQAQVRGDVPVTTWTLVSGDIYVADGPTSAPASVVWNWDDNTHADGRHFGHLVPGSFAALAQGEWGYDAASDTIRVWLPSEAGVTDPDDLTEIAWTSANTIAGIEVEGTNVLIDGLFVHLWVGEGAYCISLNGVGSNLQCNNCTCFDGGFHCIGCHASTISGHIANCTAGGCRQDGGTTYVMYGDDAGLVFTGTWADCTVLMGGLLTDTDATPMTGGTSGGGAGGFICHTNGTTRITDLVARRINTVGNALSDGTTWRVADTASETDVNDGETYPVRFYDCVEEVVGKGVLVANGISRGAFFRCRCVLDSNIIGVGSGTVTSFETSSTDCRIYMECCSISVDQGDSGGSNARQVFSANGTLSGRLVLVNCSVWFTNTTSSNACCIRFSGTTARVRAQQCVFQVDSGAEDRRFCRGGNNAAYDDGNAHEFIDCWYDGFLDTAYSQNLNFDNIAEWTPDIDPDGVYNVDPIFTSTTDLTPFRTSPLLTTKKFLEGPVIRVPAIGINGRVYDGTYGAYQGGSQVYRNRGRPLRRTEDGFLPKGIS